MLSQSVFRNYFLSALELYESSMNREGFILSESGFNLEGVASVSPISCVATREFTPESCRCQIEKKLEPLPVEAEEEMNLNPCLREKTNCTIFLGFTSNLISCGVRDTIRYLVQHNMVRRQSQFKTNRA